MGELGPEKLGHLNPGQEATTSLTVASEPKLAGVSYDGYVVHMEVFDCGGPGPAAHAGGQETEGGIEGGGGEHGTGGEGGGEDGTGGESGNESVGAGGEEGSGADTLALDETFDAVRSGARLILKLRRSNQLLHRALWRTRPTGVLDRVRIEVHLSNGN